MRMNLENLFYMVLEHFEKLYNMVKGIKKWHDRRAWQVCFPFTDRNNDEILNYITAAR